MPKMSKTSIYKNTDKIACKLCKRNMQFINTKAHYTKKHKKYLKENGMTRDWSDRVCKPDYTEIASILKIEKIHDVGEVSIVMENGKMQPRGPFVSGRVQLDATHLKK